MRAAALIIGFFILVPTFALAAPKGASAPTVKKARTTAPVARTSARADYNCSDFATQKAAQQEFIAAGGPQQDPYRLDADKDGIACENLK